MTAWLRRNWFPASFAGVVFVIGVLEASLRDFDTWERPAGILFSALWSLPFLWARRSPVAVAAAVIAVLVVAASVVPDLFDPGVSSLFAYMGAAFIAGTVEDVRVAVAGLLGILAAVVAVVVIQGSPSDIGGNVIVGSLMWTAGLLLSRRTAQTRELRERAERLERDREEQARVAVQEERARIARELHDVVAHGVSVMVVQAGGVRRLLEPDQERQRNALLAIERTGREALAEMRRMLGVMRGGDDGPALAPQPGLGHLDRLVAQVRDAGLPVELAVEGEPVALPPGIDLSAYRIVQEGLTNALKHAHAAHADVRVRYEPDAVEIEVADDGRGAAANGDGPGHGLIGMRERISLYGGDLEAGPAPGGGFRLRARLPVDGGAR